MKESVVLLLKYSKKIEAQGHAVNADEPGDVLHVADQVRKVALFIKRRSGPPAYQGAFAVLHNVIYRTFMVE